MDLVALGSTLALLLLAACAEHSDKWKQAECIPGASDKPPCPRGTVCLEEDWSCHSLCLLSSSECDSAVEACFLSEGVCRVYRAECDPGNPSCMEGFYCSASGACTKRLSVGSKCGDSDECWSGACANGVCCNDSCSDPCVACVEFLTGESDGRCEPILSGMMPPAPCPDYTACDGTGQCFAKPLGSTCGADTECSSLHCADHVCCDATCDGLCQACTAARSGGADGTCTPIPAGQDPDTECNQYGCNGAGRCVQGAANGVACGDDGQCDSGFCVDDVCCESACEGTCEACGGPSTGTTSPAGQCAPVSDLVDLEAECPGGYGCNGTGGCNPVLHWSGARTIETSSRDATAPRVVVDDLGNAAAVWIQNDGSGFKLWANRYEPGRGWGAATVVGETAYSTSETPLAVDGQGNVIAAWRWENDQCSQIRVARYVAEFDEWETPSTASSGCNGYGPSVAASPNGYAVLAWVETDSIMAATLSSTSGWSTGELVASSSDDTKQVLLDPRGTAIASNGVAHVAWHAHDFVEGSVWSAHLVPGNAWTDPEKLEHVAGLSTEVRLAGDPSGNVLAVWARWDSDTERSKAWANPFNAGGTWNGPVLLAAAAGYVSGVDVASTWDGHAIAVWDDRDAASAGLFAATYDPVRGWSAGTPAASPAGLHLRVEMDAMGNAVCVWRAKADGREFWAARHVRGAGWEAPVGLDLQPDSTIGPSNADLAVGPRGHAVAVWVESLSIWANVLE